MPKLIIAIEFEIKLFTHTTCGARYPLNCTKFVSIEKNKTTLLNELTEELENW
jgi:predicted thioredoxin/glutaredoxin